MKELERAENIADLAEQQDDSDVGPDGKPVARNHDETEVSVEVVDENEHPSPLRPREET